MLNNYEITLIKKARDEFQKLIENKLNGSSDPDNN